MTNWERVVALARVAFGEGLMEEEALCQAVFLIPKGKGEYHGIGLVEVIWEAVLEILNLRLTASITYHDFLHLFWAGHGTGTATLEAKLLQQLASLRKEVLYVISMDLHNSYDALDRFRCLEILEGYGVGPRAFQILRTYWRWLRMVAKAGGYYGSVFQGSRGVTQGDPLSPTIFNVVADALVRHWVAVMVERADERSRHRQEGIHQNSLFYADYGIVASPDLIWLQGAFSTLLGLFDKVGLKTNTGKTAGMVCCPFQAAGTQSESAYRRRMIGEGTSY